MTTLSRLARVDDILAVVCDEFGVTPEQLHSRRRAPRIVAAREMFVHIARRHTIMSYPEIAREVFGRPSHSSAIGAHRRVRLLIQADPATAERVERLSMALRDAARLDKQPARM